MYITFFILLVITSAFFSGSETAFLSLDKLRIKQIEQIKRPSAKRVLLLLEDTRKLLVAILIGNTLVNIAASSVLAGIFYSKMGGRGVPVSILSMTIIILIFGEVTPKMYSLANSLRVSRFSSVFLCFFSKIIKPIRFILMKISDSIVKLFGFNVTEEPAKFTEQEIMSLFSLGSKQGIVKKAEKEMIESILEFKESNAADIMTPRINVVALDITISREELIKNIKDSQYSRYPVYIHTIDNIVGLIHAKDFLLNIHSSARDLIKKPYYAPESMKIDDLLQELQKNHTHMAVVTDEYGVTSGVVTIEDILEEIVGEIRDELDTETPNIKKIDQKTFELKGQTHIDEVAKVVGLLIETEEVDTIGGYVTLLIGKIPQAGDRIKIDNFLIKINDVSKNRITKLEIEITEKNKSAE